MKKFLSKNKLKYIKLTRGFFSLPVISILNRLLEKKEIFNKTNYFVSEQINYSQINKSVYSSPTYSTFYLKPKL